MKNKNIENWIIKIIRLKINLDFIIIFSFGIMYVAENYMQEGSFKTLCFGITLLVIIMFNLFTPMRSIFNIIEEIVVERKDIMKLNAQKIKKRSHNESAQNNK